MQFKADYLRVLLVQIFLIGYFEKSKAWVAIGQYHNDAHPGKCFISDDLILSPGETARSPTECCNISCQDANGMASLTGCSVVEPPPNCEWTDFVDPAAPYPMCCLRNFHCPNPANETRALDIRNDLNDMFTRQMNEDLKNSMVTLTQKNEL